MSKRKIFNLILIIITTVLYLNFTIELVLAFLRMYPQILSPENFRESVVGVFSYFTVKFLGIIEYFILIVIATIGAIIAKAFGDRKSKAYFLVMIVVSFATALANYLAYEIVFSIR
ncbi:MAG: hypothetical protein J6A53_05825 [Clostridia bacterium]|nr:hypothetical protein [Clostridia bacterium]